MTPLRFAAHVSTFALLAATALAHTPNHYADQVFRNGNIHTMDPDRPRAEALATRGDRIIAIGSSADLKPLIGPQTKLHDLSGKTVLPGLIDAHCHVASLGSFGLGHIDLSYAESFDDVVQAVAERVKTARPGQWILGGRWDHESWPERKMPAHTRLSAVSPDNPVWLTRVDGHVSLANAAAMKLAGITVDTRSPPGGEIIRDERGSLTGLFVDNADVLIVAKIDDPADPADLILKAQELCLAVGLTGLHDAGITPGEVAVYRQLADSGKLKIRVYAMVAARAAEEYFAQHGLLIGDRLTVRSAKLFADGAMGSRGAWMYEPYADRPTDSDGRPYTGLNLMTPEFIRRLADDGLRKGYQLCTHAIGDRANRETLDAYESALKQHPQPDHRFRIEHAQVLSPQDIPRFATLGVVPAMQPTHATSDMRWCEARIGPQRSRGAYAWASVLRAGARIAGGSDFPVESHNPFLGIYAAITRQDKDGNPPGGWYPEQCMTRTEVLRSFTIDAAYAAFEEGQKGSLTAGKLADFIIIDRDVMTCPPREILGTRVIRTILGGEPVYSRPPACR